MKIFETGTSSYRPCSDPITTQVDTTWPEDNFKGLSSFLVRPPPAKIGTCPISENGSNQPALGDN